MHAPATVHQALALRDTGLGPRRIARLTGVPVGTVRDWLAGRLPHSVRPLENTCVVCRGSAADLPEAYAYLLGLYLGDGCLSTHPRGVYRLRIVLDARYPQIIAACGAAIAAVVPTIRIGHVNHPGCVEVSAYWKHWPCFFPQHGPGKKHLRAIKLAPWQDRKAEKYPEALLRGLIHSDGCRFQNTGRNWRHPRYSFVNLSTDIRGIFTAACDRLAIAWTVSGQKTIYVSRKADVARLDEFIGPKR